MRLAKVKKVGQNWAACFRGICQLTLLLACTGHASAAVAQGICPRAWDGDWVAGHSRNLAPGTRLPLRAASIDITAAQVLAFHDAKEAINRHLQRHPRFILCDDPEANAFAANTDNGEVMGITFGMLRLVDGDRDMAAEVVGHEMAHHLKNHMAAAQSRKNWMAVAGLLIGIALEKKMQPSNRGLGLDLGVLGVAMVSRKFDRDQEREADDLGLQYMVAAGFNPQGALRMAQRMGQLGSTSGLFLDSHPGWQERGRRLEQQIAASPGIQQALARTGPPAGMEAATTRKPDDAPPIAGLAPTYVSTAAQRSFADGISALRLGYHAVALRHMLTAANLGYGPAQFVSGSLLVNGAEGVPVNEGEGVRLYKLAAEQGVAAAMNNLAILYATGKAGLPQSNEQALQLYRRAVELGTSVAAKNLADAHFYGRLGLPKDPAAALPLYRQASEQGSADATGMLSVYYVDGLAGQPVDPDKVMELNRMAASQGSARAQLFLAAVYEDGIGVPRDYDEAARYYKRAADHGNAQAQVRLGLAFAEGRGVAKDESEAVRWFRLARAQGSDQAKNELEKRGLAH